MSARTIRRLVGAAVAISCIVLAVGRARAKPFPRLVGPMVGHVTPTQATIWAYSRPPTRIRLAYRAEGAPLEASQAVMFPPIYAGPEMARVTIHGLEPDTTYVYRVFPDGELGDPWQGRFRTAPPEGRPARFRMGVSSCMNPKHGDHLGFRTMLQEGPVFHLLLGDNVYADTTNRGVLWEEHIKMRSKPQFAALIRNAATYAIWDDHDFAGNDLDGTVANKAESLAAFRELFANPSAGLPSAAGVFFRFSWGDVDFFMLDGRYHRSPNGLPDGPAKTMLGAVQFRWLVNGLRTSKARFKVVCSGSTLDEGGEDSWQPFGYERRRLFGEIAQGRIEGVLFLTGDLHRSLVKVHPASETGFYDLYEVISSGIAMSDEGSFAILDFDTTLADPQVHVRILYKDRSLHGEQTILRSQLRFGS